MNDSLPYVAVFLIGCFLIVLRNFGDTVRRTESMMDTAEDKRKWQERHRAIKLHKQSRRQN